MKTLEQKLAICGSGYCWNEISIGSVNQIIWDMQEGLIFLHHKDENAAA